MAELVLRFAVGVALLVLGGCRDAPPDPGPSSERECGACPACASTMICLGGASLRCDESADERPYSPIACVRPDGTRHGQYKEFEFIDQRWIETDGWYVDGRPVGKWVSIDATGRVIRVVDHVDGQAIALELDHR